MDDPRKFVKQILSSRKYQKASEEEQDRIIEQIEATGVPLETIKQVEYELFMAEDSDQNNEVLSQEVEDVQSNQAYITENDNNINFLEQIPYDVFVSLVRKGEIRGKSLINLCQTSSKLNSYCNRSFTISNGQILTKYLFRQLLADAGITYPESQDPQQVYINYSKYRGFSTAALLELLAQIIQNYIYGKVVDAHGHRHAIRVLAPEILKLLPGIKLPDRLSVRVIKDLVRERWITDVNTNPPFSPLTAETSDMRSLYVFKSRSDEAANIDNFRAKIYDLVLKSLSWLVEEKEWPPSIHDNGPANVFTLHNLIFTGTGISRSRLRRLGFNAWLEAVLKILTITDRDTPWVNKLTKI
jgi:hypothetical protein